MSIRKFAFICTLLTLGLIVIGYQNFGSAEVPTIHGADPHHLRTGSSLFMPIGTYGFAFNMTGASYNGNFRSSNSDFLNLLSANQLNYSRFWLNWGALTFLNSQDDWDKKILTPFRRTGPGLAIDGLPKLNLNEWNPDYFVELAYFIDYANSKNIVVQAVMLDCWHVGQYGAASGFLAFDFYNSINNINGVSLTNRLNWTDPNNALWQKHSAFIKKVIDTVGNRPNIIWETCNENTDNPTFDVAIANLITSYEQTKGYNPHLVIPRDIPGHLSVAGHKLPAPSGQETFSSFRNNLLSQRNWGKPLISDNDCCTMDPPSDIVRKKAWIATASGAYVDIFAGNLFDYSYRNSSNVTLYLRYLKYLRNFVITQSFSPLNMNSLASNVQLISTGKAFYTFGKLLNGAINKLLVYLPDGGSVKILGLPPVFTVIEFNPRTGTSRTVSLVNGIYNPPDSNDWAIYIRANVL